MGTRAFLFTDIEGSSRLWEDHEQSMRTALAEHDRLIEEAIESHEGRIFSTMGDGVAAAFESTADALRSAVAIQRGLAEIRLDGDHHLRVRMGIHAGEVEERDGDFFGPAVNRAARIMAAGHGGQVLVSLVAARLAESTEFGFVDLGEHRLRDLGRAEHIHQVVADGLLSEFPPLRTLTEAPNNLPASLSTFIGRDAEVGEVIERLASSRLVTITGVGGVGKTRLALQAAAEMAPRFPDGTWLVPLATVTDPSEIDAAFLEGLDIQPTEGLAPREAVLDHLSRRSLLLVVDNCEHLIDASAEIISSILGKAPDVHALITSREILNVTGEVAYGLRSMSLPAGAADPAWAESDAIRLFLERAAQADSRFMSDGHEEAITEICRRLDGIPLAMELATARLRSFSPERIAGLLEEGFRLLTGATRTAVPRQRTLEATIEWSHRLLDEDERILFRRLAVFSGGFTVEGAQAVCTGDDLDEFAVLDVLPALVDKSLVARMTDSDERFHLLETIRQFAGARLESAGEGDPMRRRHAQHFRDLVEEAGRLRWGPQGPAMTARVRAERDNLRQAIAWSVSAHEAELALDLALGFGRFSDRGRWAEPLHWYEAALEIAGDPPDEITRAIRIHHLAAFVGAGPDSDRAVALSGEAIEIFEALDDGSSIPPWLPAYAMTIMSLAVTRFYRGEGGERNEHFRALVETALDVARRAGHDPLIVSCLGNLAHHVDPEADPTEVRALFAEAEAKADEVGASIQRVGLAWQRARFEFHAGDLLASRQAWKSAIALAVDAGETDRLPDLQLGLATAESEQGSNDARVDIDSAIRAVLQSYDSLSSERAISQSLLLARASADRRVGRMDLVAKGLGASQSEADRDVPVPWDLMRFARRLEDDARSTLGDDRFESIRSEGSQMTHEEIGQFLVEDRQGA